MNSCPDNQFRKAARDRLPLNFVKGREYPDGFGNAEVGENEKAFPVGSALKQAGRFRRKLVVIGQKKPEQDVRVEEIFLHRYLRRRTSRAFSRSSLFEAAGRALLRAPARSMRFSVSGRRTTPSSRIS
jgi:hypothetical protein